jgi:hypothetical protein
MRRTSTIIFSLLTTVLFLLSPRINAQVLFSDDFESGSASTEWEHYFSALEPGTFEELIEAIDMASIPRPLANGGDYAGYLQDADGSYTGAALSVAGETTWQNYSIEGDVYCYVGQSPSAYTGLAVYSDSTIGTYIKLAADFDADQRLRLYNNRLDPITFQYSFIHNFTASDIPGGVPTVDDWHHMKIEVKTLNADTTAFWCYFDGEMLLGCPIYDTSDDRMSSGQVGAYSFQQDGDGIAGYYDNIVVTSLVTGVDDNPSNIVSNFSLEQNYPNPFNPETKINYQLAAGGFVTLGIYDLLGREIKLLVNEEQPYGRYTVNWNGTDNFGNKVPSGIYMYTLRTAGSVITKKMVLMK